MQLTAEKRDVLGKKVRALRAQGLVPAELYGHGSPNVHLAVPRRDLVKLLKTEGPAALVDLIVDGVPQRVLIHDMQHSAQTDEIDHVDFYVVRKDEKVKVHIPVTFLNEAPAVKNEGAVVNKNVLEIEIEALPDNLPHELTVDLSSLTATDMSIHAKDIAVPNGVELHIDPEAVIVSTAAPREEEVVEPVAPTEGEEPIVESEEKKAARDAKKEEGGTEQKGEAASE